MKSVIICGSISAAEEILRVQKELVEQGRVVEIPLGVKKYVENGYQHVSELERSSDKKENDLIRRYYELIKDHDCVLVVNAEKNGVDGYIGGNTFLEMAFGHVLDKKLYVLNRLPKESSYLSELEAMQPVVIGGDLEKVV